MKAAFEVLMAVSLVGGVDVLWFHLYRHRLHASSPSVLEQLTHLARHVLFAVLSVGLVTGAPKPMLLAVFAVDLVNSVIDLWLEPRSRASMGGVSGPEAALHGVAAFGLGSVAALVWSADTTWLPSDVDRVRGLVTAAAAVVLFSVELGLTIRHRVRQEVVAS